MTAHIEDPPSEGAARTTGATREALLMCREDGRRTVCAVSDGFSRYFRDTERELLGASLAEALGSEGAELVEHALADGGFLRYATQTPVAGHTALLSAHRRGPHIAVELELAPTPADLVHASHVVQSGVRALRSARCVESVAATTAEILTSLLGFDRVLVQRLACGSILAEAPQPSSDGAAAAAVLALATDQAPCWRSIPDVTCAPPTLRWASDADQRRARQVRALPGTTRAQRRALAACGVRAVLTIPLEVDGRAWGQIICLHESPRVPPPTLRVLGTSFLGTVALRIEALRSAAHRVHSGRLEALLTRLETAVAGGSEPLAWLAGQADALHIAGADGLAVVTSARTLRLGRLPADDELQRLLARLREKAPDGTWVSDDLGASLGAETPAAAAVIARPLDDDGDEWLLWTRTEPQHAKWERDAVGAASRLAHVLTHTLARWRLMQSHQDLTMFSQAVAHDLRAPLRTIASSASLLNERRDVLDDEGQAFLARIAETAERMAVMLGGLLELSTTDAQTERPGCDAERALDEALQNLAPDIDDCAGEIVRDPLPRLAVPHPSLVLLFQNLVGNALKFRRDGVPPRVEVRYTRDGRYGVLRVRDNGVGFPQERADHVFAPFARLEPQRTGGTGLGLAMCKRVVERHGGSIAAESQSGQGSVFRVTLPLG